MPSITAKPGALFIYMGDPREVEEDFDHTETPDKRNKGTVLTRDSIHDDITMEYHRFSHYRNHSFGLSSGTFKEHEKLSPNHEEDYTLFPRRVCGFVFSTHKWANLLVENIRPFARRSSLWNELQIPEQYKKTLEASIKNHVRDSRTKQPEADLVRGKGVGVVVLLQGPPGVGKTYTAEAIAEDTKRALYPITPAELGSNLSHIDKNLNTILNRGRKWGCILLLDEADVYFMPRGADDLQRNCIVSSFLRQIEYYTGIVFLTTNRIVGLDEAIVSRVTIPLVYQPLNRLATGRLWETYCKNVKRFIPLSRSKNPPYINVNPKARDWWEGQYNEAIKQRRPWWSGRQIQIAFRQAVELANWDYHSSDNDVLNLEEGHFQTVSTLLDGFNGLSQVRHSLPHEDIPFGDFRLPNDDVAGDDAHKPTVLPGEMAVAK